MIYLIWADVLLNVESEHRQVEYEREPVTINKEQEGQEGVDSSLGDDICVEAIAQIDRVDVVTAREISMSVL